MSSEHSDLKNWAESLRDRVSRVSGRNKSAKIAGFNAELKGELLDAIDLLLEQAEEPVDEEQAPSWLEHVPNLLEEPLQKWKASVQEELGNGLASSLNQNVAALSSDLAENVRQSLLTELQSKLAEVSAVQGKQINDGMGRLGATFHDAIKSLESTSQSAINATVESSIVPALNNALAENVSTTLSQALEEKLSGAFGELQAHLDGTLGRAFEDSLKPSLAEIERNLSEAFSSSQNSNNDDALRELSKQQQNMCEQMYGLQDLLHKLSEQSDSNDAQTQSFDNLTAELRKNGLVDPQYVEDLEKMLSDSKSKQQDLERQIGDLKKLKQELDDVRTSHDELSRERDDLSGNVAKLKEENKELESYADEILGQKDELKAKLLDAEQLEIQVSQLKDELEESRRELESALKSQGSAKGDEVSESEIEELLAIARNEIEDLRNQNSDLAAQVAKQQVLQSNSAAQLECDEENLSWEDRKRLIMQQFMEEDASSQNRIEIEQVIATTDRELEKREQKISELEERVNYSGSESQIQEEILGNDEIIREEREKLQEVRREWEEKLRQAEIDLSMERAKLARERTELESARNEQNQTEEPEANSGKGRTRKWLDHLGLREDNRKSKPD